MRYLLLCFLLAPTAFAHEGHDHDSPTTVQAPKGGVVKSLEQTNVEVVSKGKAITIYLYGKDMKPRLATDFKITAKAELPRKKGSEEIPLTAKENSFEGSFDAKGSHRFTLALAIVDSRTKHNDKLTFTIEPRK